MIKVTRVGKPDRGGYINCQYFGAGDPIYYVDFQDNISWFYIRAKNIKEAKDKVRNDYPSQIVR
jgi:hypothetical protein